MSLAQELEVRTGQKEIFFDTYGTFLVTDKTAYPLMISKDEGLENSRNVVLVSEPDWKSTLNVLENNNFGNTTVLTPELITTAGLPFNEIKNYRLEIENSLKKVSEISSSQPDATFVI